VRQPFFHQLVDELVAQMGEAYPELPAARDTVQRALKAEEERFAETLDAGMKIFEDVAAHAAGAVIPGVDAFRLYDTYGFPLDLTVFLGYDALEAEGRKVVALLHDGRPVDSGASGEEAIALLDRTPFYAESGGQVGDTGVLEGEGAKLQVGDTQKFAGQFHG